MKVLIVTNFLSLIIGINLIREVSSGLKSNNYDLKKSDIIKIIDKVFTSQILNELADMIAEKAVEKMKFVQNSAVTQSDEEEKFEGIINRASKSKEIPINNKSNKKARKNQTKHKTQNVKFKPSKTDMQAFLKRESSSSEISLKYKRFTKSSQNEEIWNLRSKSSDNENFEEKGRIKNDFAENNFDDQIVDKMNRTSDTELSSENKKFESKENEKLDSINLKGNNTNKKSIKDKNEEDTSTENQYKRQKSKEIKDEEFEVDNENENRDSDKETNEFFNLNKSKETKINDSHSKQNKPNRKQKTTKHLFINKKNEIAERNQQNNDRDVTDIDININKNQSTSENSKSKNRKHIVRREGNKLFTYETSPDYEEYHEVLTKKLNQETKD